MSEHDRPQRVAITGSSGLIGGALSAYLTARGDEVRHLVRRPPRAAHEAYWNPASRTLDPAALEGVDAVVHLAGVGVGDKRWTPAYQQQILASRVDGTHTVATAMAATGAPMRLVSGSAVGIYGDDRGEETLTEDSEPGSGFLVEVVRAWEAAAEPARAAGLSVAHARGGTMVLSGRGGAMGRILRLANLGLFGPLGGGRQYWSWITLHDEVRALAHLVDRPEIVGPVNLSTPRPTRQRDLAAELGRQLHRPAFLPAPAPAIRLVLGGFADAVLGSQKVLPSRLVASGFAHDHVELDLAISWVLSQRR